MNITDLKPAAYNPRKITDAQLERLKKSLKEFGDLSCIVFNVRTQTLIGGHQRVKNFSEEWEIVKKSHKDKTGTIATGYIETPSGRMAYREVDWPEEKEKKANIAANKHGGEFDDDLLKQLLDDMKIKEPDLDMELMGFDINELSDNSARLNYEEKELKPYKLTHVLLSFPPEKLMQIREHLQKIIETEGVEYEQSAN